MEERNISKNIKGVIYGIIYGLVARGIIELEYNVLEFKTSGLMTLSFMFLVPIIIGVITTYKHREVKSAFRSVSLSMPIFSILGFVLITILFELEGLICAIMAIPVFAILAFIGGFIGIKMFRRTDNHAKISLLILLPIILAPLEQQLGLKEKVFNEKTSIIVTGGEAQIWDNITRVYYIEEDENQRSLFQLMGFPRPLEATLDTVAVGGIRIAKFDRGLFFTETVTEMIENRKLKFSIVADPNAIPPKALDEHVLVGGAYFDVLNGCYEITPLSEPNTYRIDLTSEFRLSTNFNLYSGFWSKLIMRDIQNNILGVLKRRVETRHQNK